MAPSRDGSTNLHREALVADGHNDLLMLVARRPDGPAGMPLLTDGRSAEGCLRQSSASSARTWSVFSPKELDDCLAHLVDNHGVAAA